MAVRDIELVDAPKLYTAACNFWHEKTGTNHLLPDCWCQVRIEERLRLQASLTFRYPGFQQIQEFGPADKSCSKAFQVRRIYLAINQHNSLFF
jgi:hypothetical protein